MNHRPSILDTQRRKGSVRLYFIVREVVTRGKESPVKYWPRVTFWTGSENGFGCRHFAKSYATLDEASEGSCDVASYYFSNRNQGLFHGNEVEIVQEISPGVYKAPDLADW
jgi:hypothetical protein